MAALAALVLLVVLVFGVLAERGLRALELERIERSLEARALLVRDLVGEIPVDREHAGELDAIADRAARASGARVTLVSRDGGVVGDSDVPGDALARVANHADRPEIASAFVGSIGTSARRSSTVGRALLYLAIPVESGEGGAVRLAVDLSEMEAAVADLRSTLVTAGAIGLLAAVALSYGLSWLTLRPLEEMRRVAAAIAGGDLDDRLSVRTGDELGEISNAINRMAEQLRERLAEMTREKDQLDAVLDGMVEGVLVVDATQHVMVANERLRDFFGMTGEVIGRSPIEVIRNTEIEEVLQSAGETDAPVSREVDIHHPRPLCLSIQAVRFPSGSGRRLGTVAVFHDISELKRLEQVRRDFVANASHELRTPLAAIQGFAETLLGSPDLASADVRSYIEIIDRHARRLGNLVRDLLELSRIESREPHLERREVDVAAVAGRILADWSARFAEKQLEIRESRPAHAIAWSDPQMLEQILTNLIDNACKYTDPGGTLELGVAPEGDVVRIWVSDSGIGIPHADRDRIFERFFRVDRARSRALGGTGLGLSIVKHLVQSQGGEISVESEPGKGSTFTFTLPGSEPEHANSEA
jgi:two-component system phosphate regulon sensor histidine kinase PhoR